MIKKIAIALVFAVLATVGVGLVLPRTWSVERSIVIARPAAMIYPYLFDLRRWQEWAVWTRAMDPQVRHTYEGPQDGVGAKWLWLGPKMGRGQLEITAADPARGIELAQSLESNEVNARGVLRFSTEAAGTRVTWRDEGTLPLCAGLFRGKVETRLGEHLEASLEKLQRTVEALPEPVPPAPPPEVDAGLPDAG